MCGTGREWPWQVRGTTLVVSGGYVSCCPYKFWGHSIFLPVTVAMLKS
jgi:hypothetical protein